MHYAEYKHADPSLVRDMVETFPFATFMVNGERGPAVAQAPLTFRDGRAAAGALEFHLARANPIAPSMTPGTPLVASYDGTPASLRAQLRSLRAA